MHRIVLFMALAAIGLCACETTPAARSDGSNDLAGLPLTAESRAEVAQALAKWSAPEMQEFCTDAEIEFLTASLIGYAVFEDEEATAPWSAAEQARVEALIQKFERLGGDAGGISNACETHVQATVP